MYYRKLGNTGEKVSEVGFGSNRLGECSQPDEHWANLVRKAIDLGVTVLTHRSPTDGAGARRCWDWP